MKLKVFAAVFAVLFLLLSGCVTEPEPAPEPGPGPESEAGALADESGATFEGIKETVSRNNNFAFEMYRGLNKEGENLFISPWSISSAFAIAFEGARGETAEEMAEVLHLSDNETVRRSSFAGIYNILNEENEEFELETANALWAEQSYKFLDSYVGLSDDFYKANTKNMDFVNAAEASRQEINAWVEGKTNNLIKDLIPQGVITDLTRLVITNAVYFKGQWLFEFDKEKTEERPFIVSDREMVQAPMMQLKDDSAIFRYTETDSIQVLEMPYKGDRLSMLVLLPQKHDLSDLSEELDSKMIGDLADAMAPQEVIVMMPKFKFETKYLMAENLKEMGMKKAFESGVADFSGMDGTKALSISQVIHQTFVEVGELGTEAAAATGIVIGVNSMPPMNEEPIPIFNANHPFIFLIKERGTGAILFLGKVENPLLG